MVRDRALHLLSSVSVIEIDLDGIVLTPSFADELLGGLMEELGPAEFRRRIRLLNVPGSARPLIRNVLNERANHYAA